MSEEAVPFQRANLREQIKGVILQRIVSQAYPPGVRLAAERITARELGRLETQIAEMRAAYERGDVHAQSQADARFHATVVRATRNGTLERQWSLLEPFLRTYISVANGADLRRLPDRHVPV